MSYSANVYKVMIASPGDVATERQIAREVIQEWNDLHSEQTEIVLLPVSWETHSSPEMGDRPQAIINKQVLEDADLLVGIFWTRIGTPTGEAESGTVEEIQEHIKADKPVMIYFSNQPAHPDTVDKDQYSKVKDFKIYLKEKGLYHDYDSLSQFRTDFYRHLVMTVNNNDYFTKQAEASSAWLSNLSINASETHNPRISNEAKQLLLEASQSTDGIIMKVRSSQGLTIQTNRKNFIGKRDARLEAKWENAVNQLHENGFIEDKGIKGEVFAVTHKGYGYADNLKTEVNIGEPDSSVDSTSSVQQEDLKFEARTGTYISGNNNLRYCGKCFDSTPSKRVPLNEQDNGWRCNVCDKFFRNPNYNPPTRTRNNRGPMQV